MGQWMNERFSKEETQIASKYFLVFSIPPQQGTAIKTTLRCLLTPVRVAIISESNSKCWRGHAEKGALSHCWWEGKLVRTRANRLRESWKQLKRELPYIQLHLPWAPPKELHPLPQRHFHIHVCCCSAYIIQELNQPRCPSIDKWIARKCLMHKMEYYSSVKKNEIYRKTDGLRKYNIKQSHQSEKYINFFLIQIWSRIIFRSWPIMGSICVNNCKQISQQLERNSSVRCYMQTGGHMSHGGEYKVNYFSSFTSVIVFSLSVVDKYIYIKSHC